MTGIYRFLHLSIDKQPLVSKWYNYSSQLCFRLSLPHTRRFCSSGCPQGMETAPGNTLLPACANPVMHCFPVLSMLYEKLKSTQPCANIRGFFIKLRFQSRTTITSWSSSVKQRELKDSRFKKVLLSNIVYWNNLKKIRQEKAY